MLSKPFEMETPAPSNRRSNHLQSPALSTTTEQIEFTKASSAAPSTSVIRLFVVLITGTVFIVPISSSATVEQLHAEAVRRAAALKVACTTANTTLRASNHDGPILFGEDRLMDVLDVVPNHEFFLGPLSLVSPTVRVSGNQNTMDMLTA
jgi:hypothetical protein